MDGVQCGFHEVKHPTLCKNPDYYAWKKNGPGLSYELALHIYLPQLVWVKKNTKTKTNDRANFVEPGGLRSKIPDGKIAVADRGYRRTGGDPKVATPNSLDSVQLRTFKARCQMRQESFHSRIKRFRALQDGFRHGEDRHQTCFEAVCVLCVYEMELVNPLFDV